MSDPMKAPLDGPEPISAAQLRSLLAELPDDTPILIHEGWDWKVLETDLCDDGFVLFAALPAPPGDTPTVDERGVESAARMLYEKDGGTAWDAFGDPRESQSWYFGLVRAVIERACPAPAPPSDLVGALREALLESERRRLEMHGHTAVELFDEAKRAQEAEHAARERERSCYAWAKAARDKTSGLPPSRALRWIDEMGDRVNADAALASAERPGGESDG